ncbi:non-homologous end joining protein Ku [Pseudoclavibacter endophyticus]|nr:non-homologous end joining protein Ku [Pseudoclavibacter endophyticus]
MNVPVKLYSATQDHDLSLHQVHDKDGGRIRYQRRCEVCGEVVEYEDIVKAHVDDDETVVLTKDELDSLPQERSREISVVEFVPSEQVDPILFDRSYYLEPTGKSPKAYVLLRRTLEETDRTAIVQFALRQKTRLAALRVRGDVLLVQTLLWDDEVREADFPALDESVRVTKKELELSSKLVDTYAGDFDLSAFRDEYQEELRALVEAKREQGDALDTEETFGAPDEDEGAEVIDLMAALRQSVEKSRSSKRGRSRSSSKRESGSKSRASGSRSKAESATKSRSSKSSKPSSQSKSSGSEAKKRGSSTSKSTKRSTKKSA